ncbi:hypothetical protein BHE74_00035421 [Ensete ventricosum]|nr:hypothetical protein BHE74_00035421 [Ensete ventricosum]
MAPYRAVHTGPTGCRYTDRSVTGPTRCRCADRPLSGGTVKSEVSLREAPSHGMNKVRRRLVPHCLVPAWGRRDEASPLLPAWVNEASPRSLAVSFSHEAR